MKVKDIVNGISAIQKLSQIDMPISMAIKIKNNIDKFQEVLEILEKKRKHITEGIEEGEEVPEDKVKELEVYFEEELALDINILTLSDLEKNDIKISPGDLTNIIWMVDLDA